MLIEMSTYKQINLPPRGHDRSIFEKTISEGEMGKKTKSPVTNVTG